MFEGLKARLGIGGRRRRYVDVESVRDLEEISDPEATTDDTQVRIRDLAGEHPLLAVVVLVLGVVVGGMALWWVIRWAPHVLTNPWTHRLVVAGLIAGFFYRRGWKTYRARVSGHDELVLKTGDDATVLKGAFLDDLPGQAPGFIPLKGWRKFGHEPVPYTNADLSAAMVEASTHRTSDDDAAIIRLQPGDMAMTQTDYGRRIVQRTGGLRPDPQAQHTSLMATLPEFDDARANDLGEQVEAQQSLIADLRDENRALIRRNKNLKDRMNEPIEDEVNKTLRQTIQVAQAVGRGGRRGGSTGTEEDREDWVGAGAPADMLDPTASEQRELDQVEEEVTPDDDD